jgi:FAD/FMN-containing dehydrogenase
MTFADRLAEALPDGTVLLPDTPGYGEATSPDNSSFPQRPDVVVRPRTGAEVAATVALAAEAGARVAVQATGHGSGGPIASGTVLIDTSSLQGVVIDPAARTARVGAGVTWSQVQEQAEKHGLLALSGTSPSVGVAGYTFHGGVGWLVRPFGLASASLRAVSFVDGLGQLGEAGGDELWAFRGGAGLGIATELEFDLFPVAELWTGYLLWPAAHLPRLAQVWLAQVAAAPDALTSTLAVLRVPPQGPFPAELLGTAVVHLSYASVAGEPGLAAMRDAMRAVAAPAVDTTGPGDAAALSAIHLDPPVAVPARGTGWWLDAVDADRVVAIFGAGGIGEDGGLNMMEIRHVAAYAHLPEPVDGALTKVPSPFLVHAVGGADDDAGRRAVDARLAQVEAVAPGRSAPSFREGQPGAGDAYPAADLERLLATASRIDPHGVFAFQRVPRFT